MVVGEDFPFVEHPGQYPDFWNPPQAPSNILPSLAALDDLSTPDIARWYDTYPCDTYNTSFGSSETGHPHLVRLFEIRLVLNPVYDLMHQLLECHIHLSHLYFWLLYS